MIKVGVTCRLLCPCLSSTLNEFQCVDKNLGPKLGSVTVIFGNTVRQRKPRERTEKDYLESENSLF